MTTNTKSPLDKLFEKSRTTESESVAMTVRLPLEKVSFIEELAEHLGASKQETLAALIEQGINDAHSKLQLNQTDEVATKERFYLLNTNKRNNVEDGRKMVSDACASAFYEPWKNEIDKIEKGDVVFLYENGVGIVAWGKAHGTVKISDYYGDEDESHSQELEEFKTLDEPIPARKIKKVLGYPVVFLKTLTPLRNGEKVVAAINDIG